MVSKLWMDSIVIFLKEDILPKGTIEAVKMQRKASRFWLFEDQKLYKRSFSGPYMICIKQFVGATQGADLCLIRPSLKDIGGQRYRRKHKRM